MNAIQYEFYKKNSRPDTYREMRLEKLVRQNEVSRFCMERETSYEGFRFLLCLLGPIDVLVNLGNHSCFMNLDISS